MDIHANMARELTVDEAKALFDSGWWREMKPEEAARLQLYQARLCMPFSDYHAAMEKLLGRPVWTHEFARPNALIAEADGKRKAPLSPMHSLAEIVGPEKAADARVIITPPSKL
jgi:hypothetical protein